LASGLSKDQIVSLALGGQHGVAVDKKGTVYTWGNNDFGQLGMGDTNEWTGKPADSCLFVLSGICCSTTSHVLLNVVAGVQIVKGALANKPAKEAICGEMVTMCLTVSGMGLC